MTDLRKFLVHYSHFFTGNALSILLGLISFPILTRLMTQEEYGILGLATSTSMLLIALAKGGLSEGIIRFYRDYDDGGSRSSEFVSTLVVRGVMFSGMIALAYFFLLPQLTSHLKVPAIYFHAFALIGAYMIVRSLNTSIMNVMRAREKTLVFNAASVGGKVATVFLSLSLFLYVSRTLFAYLLGTVLAEIFVAGVLIYWLRSHYTLALRNASWHLALMLARFGIPLVATEMLYLCLAYADRYMIMWYKGESAVGLYSVGYNLASYIGTAVTFSLSYAVVPIYVRIYKDEGPQKTKEFLHKCLHYYLAATVLICAGYASISSQLIVALASEKYRAAAEFSPVVLVGALALGLTNILNAGLYLRKKTSALLAIMLVSVVINIWLNTIMIPSQGLWGAAMATLVASVSAVVLTVALSYRHLPISVEIRSQIVYLAIAGVMYAVLRGIHLENVWFDLAAKVTLGAALVLPAVAFKENVFGVRQKFFGVS